ncbi:site-specific integrase [Dysgonomonas sp. Marseille-P4677]|nr:site-specific integrase [Dysgonomonas sp. Marseille-P4677]
MKNTYRILFITRRKNLPLDGLTSISARITICKKAVEFNTTLRINPELWNPIGKLEGRTKEALTINNKLDKIKEKLNLLYFELLEKDGYVTAQRLKDAYLGVDIQKYTLLSLYDIRIAQKEKLVSKSICHSTYSKYLATRKRISEFIYQKYKQSDIAIKDVDFMFILDYEIFLKSVRNCGHNSCVKHLRYLKQIIEIALKNKYITCNPFDDYKLKYQAVNKEYLLDYEIQKLLNGKFSKKELEEVRDIFIFQCFTGVSYIDVSNLTEDNIILDNLGQKWLQLNRQKSNIQANIPLLSIPLSILKKYKGVSENKLLPLYSNQGMNKNLKEIASLCNIHKHLTTHVARHSISCIHLKMNNLKFYFS